MWRKQNNLFNAHLGKEITKLKTVCSNYYGLKEERALEFVLEINYISNVI